MEIYVDEMPKGCLECPCFCEYYCNVLKRDDYYESFNEENRKCCPLQLLVDHDKEVRKQVCDEIREKLGYKHNNQLVVSSYQLCKLLDQIEKGEE